MKEAVIIKKSALIRKLLPLFLALKIIILCGGCLTFPDPEERVVDFWAAYQEGDYKKAEDYTAFDVEELFEWIWPPGEDEIFSEEMFQDYVERVEITVEGHEVVDGRAYVDVSVSWPDMGYFMDRLMVEAVPVTFSSAVAGADEEKINAFLRTLSLEILEETPEITTPHRVPLELEGGDWKLVEPPVPRVEEVFHLSWGEDRDIELEEYALSPLTEDQLGEGEIQDTKEKYQVPPKEAAGAGEVVKLNYHDGLSGRVQLEVELLEILRGEMARKKVKEASPLNERPPKGKEYLLAKFRISLIEGGKKEALNISDFMFEAVSYGGVVYENYLTLEGLEPVLKVRLNEGEEYQGWTYFLVGEEDKPFAVFKRHQEGETLFNLE